VSDVRIQGCIEMGWLRIIKLRFISWCGFKLTSNERSEIAFWLTRHVTKSNEETLREVNSEDCNG